jgi:replicative DNA helicase
MGPVFENIGKRASGEVSGISTGYQCIDNAIGGFSPEDLVIIAGRPAAGKTALALCIARNIVSSGVPVALFELEMSKQQVTERLLALEGDLSVNSIKIAKYLTKTQFQTLGRVSGIVASFPLVIDDDPMLTITRLLSKARKVIRLHGARAIFVDYLGLMIPDSKQQNRVQQISEITRGLKLIAKILKVPVIALSQLNRSNVTGKEIRKPRLSDLRDSGSIEQDADIVLFVHREEMENQTPENRGQAEIIIGKNRNGPCGFLEVRYIAESCKFEELTKAF